MALGAQNVPDVQDGHTQVLWLRVHGKPGEHPAAGRGGGSQPRHQPRAEPPPAHTVDERQLVLGGGQLALVARLVARRAGALAAAPPAAGQISHVVTGLRHAARRHVGRARLRRYAAIRPRHAGVTGTATAQPATRVRSVTHRFSIVHSIKCALKISCSVVMK